MTTRAEVRDEILQLTARPDRKDAVDISINQIVRKLAGTGRYNQALWEAVYTTSDYLVSGSTTVASITLPVRFNGIAYVSHKEGCTFHPIIPGEDNADVPRQYYVSGANLLISPVDSTKDLLIGWYLYPTKMIDDSETNWVLDRMDHLVVDIGAAYVMTAIGDRSSAQALLAFARQFEQQEIAFAKALSGE